MEPRRDLWTDVHGPSSHYHAGRRSTLNWFRAGRSHGPLTGFVVTWDVDSRDGAICRRLQRFIYGYETTWEGRMYRHRGFIEGEGVRYLGQSVLLVRQDRMPELMSGLSRLGVDFEVDQASVG